MYDEERSTDVPTRTCPRCGRTTASRGDRCVLCRQRLPEFGAPPPRFHLDVALGILMLLVTAAIVLTVTSTFWLAILFDPMGSGSGWYVFIITLVVTWFWGPPLVFINRESLNPAIEEPYYSRCRWRLYWQAQMGTLAVTIGLILLLFTVCVVIIDNGRGFH